MGLDLTGKGSSRRKGDRENKEISINMKKKEGKGEHAHIMQDSLRCMYTNSDSLPNKFDELKSMCRKTP